MNVYRLLKINKAIKNPRIKFLGIATLHKMNKRYLALNFDPVMACNLRCKMCYFTDAEYVRSHKGLFPKEDLDRLAEILFPRALKLQVGCGTEPTMYKDLSKIFELGKKYNVPHISITTNANLLTREKVHEWVSNGLKEFTISLHGVHKDSYEHFMGKASYEKFHEAMDYINDARKINPGLILRVNYTFNKDNFAELKDFFEVFGKYNINVLQVRPIKDMGNTEYHNLDLTRLENVYNETLLQISAECKKQNITLLATSSFKNLMGDSDVASVIFRETYCYIRPGYVWRDDFDWKNETFNQYSKRKKLVLGLIKTAFSSPSEIKSLKKKTSLNYEIS